MGTGLGKLVLSILKLEGESSEEEEYGSLSDAGVLSEKDSDIMREVK